MGPSGLTYSSRRCAWARRRRAWVEGFEGGLLAGRSCRLRRMRLVASVTGAAEVAPKTGNSPPNPAGSPPATHFG
jgi:hypothetical protein